MLIAVHPQTQLLGATLAGALACLAAALVLAAKRVAVHEVAVEDRRSSRPRARGRRGAGARPAARRRRDHAPAALGAAAGVAGAGLAGALVLPVTALGPALGDAPNQTPWRRGRRLVTTDGAPLRADAIEIGPSSRRCPRAPTSASSARPWSSCASTRAR